MVSKAVALKRKENSKQRTIGRKFARQAKVNSISYVSRHVESFILKDLWGILFHRRVSLIVNAINFILEDEELTTAEKIERMAEFMLDNEEELRPEALKSELPDDERLKASLEGTCFAEQDEEDLTSEELGKYLEDCKRQPASLDEAYFDDQLLNMIFYVKNVRHFGFDGFVIGKTVEEHFDYKNYSGIQFLICYRYAKNKYGCKDKKSGQIIPFMQLFNSAFQFKKKNIEREYLEEKLEKHENRKLKKVKLKELLTEAYSLAGKDKKEVPEIIVNEEWMEEKLAAVNAPKSFFENMKSIIDNSFVSTGESALQYIKEENGEEIEICWGDKNEKFEYEAKMVAVFALWDTVEAAFEKLKAEGRTKDLELLNELITIKCIPYYKQLDTVSQVMLQKFMDPSLLAYLLDAEVETKGNERDLEALIYADYKGLKYNTARKKLNVMRKYLADCYLTIRY